MDPSQDTRPDPDALLRDIQSETTAEKSARLKIFFGMSAGVGKTYDMLLAARAAKSQGVDVVIGIVETHGRVETQALLEGLPVIPRKRIVHKGIALEEMDLDAILARHPALVLVDELAHTNAPGSRHTKRHADVIELLDHGIDVYTTLNVQHLESRADTVAQITGIQVRETVPDSILDRADDVALVDIPADELLARLREGKVYSAERSAHAAQNFFRKGNLTALREMALRVTAERVDTQLRDYMRGQKITGPWKSGQRLIVGISGSPHATHLIRWTRRHAMTLGATWVAVHVDMGEKHSKSRDESLAQNIALARSLGAEIVTTADNNVPRAILRIAHQENCTQILVGKTRGNWLHGRRNMVAELIEGSGDLDIHVVGGDEGHRTRPSFSVSRPQSSLTQYAASAGVVAALTSVCLVLTPVIGYQSVGLLLLSGVAFLSLRLGIGPVLLAAVLSALSWDFLFIPPLLTFSIGRLEDAMLLFMYFCIATVTGVLTSRSRTQERALRQREERAVALYSLSRDLSHAHNRDQVVGTAVASIQKFFQTPCAVLLGQTDGDIFTAPHPESSYAVDEKDFAVAAWVYWNEKKAGRFTETLSGAGATYYPLTGPRYPLGVVGIASTNDRPLSNDQEALLENFLSQISSAIERETMSEVARKAVVIEESEKLYKTLFESLSHETRTPLAAMMGAAENLRDPHIASDAPTREKIALEIHEAADRLNLLFENLLDMTRIESGLVRPAMDWCDIHDIVNAARMKTQSRLAGHEVVVQIHEGVPLLKADFGLMEQVFINLLLNACAYTPSDSTIAIRVSAGPDSISIIVADNGPGFAQGEEKRIFEKFYRSPGTSAGGTGLGLSIVKGFVEAHRGTVLARNAVTGGAEFVILLPYEKPPAVESIDE